ncbi:hypothetical protein E1B28_010981 [Marasmius oreades]|uniref:Uncharacterized protein n=1 Tax=Marasmius oreades TaxID=181124 RepID=A0A9P7UPH1_9AGAR|nr:uncharacterized protein E1B28_010981 [Marasmius oreades]KAG7089283.1 hypothetical protein E1B28_010981 [Marasmius oreades]
MSRRSTTTATTPNQVERSAGSHFKEQDDIDCIQEILSKFYLQGASESSDSLVASEDDECLEASDNERGSSHSHCGKGELEAGELYDLYGDDEEDARSSSQESEEYDDYPPEISPTRELQGSLPPKLPTKGQEWLHYDGRLNYSCDATFSKPKPSKDIDVNITVAIETPLSDYTGRSGSGEIGCGVDDMRD